MSVIARFIHVCPRCRKVYTHLLDGETCSAPGCDFAVKVERYAPADQLRGAVEALPELRRHLESARPWIDPMAFEIVDELQRCTGGQS